MNRNSKRRDAAAWRVVQLTDCHLGLAPGTLYRGADPDHSLERIVHRLTRRPPDLLVASGDLAEAPAATVYHRLRRLLLKSGAPLLVLPGNHDHRGLLRAAFAPVAALPGDLISLGPWVILGLDSTQPGRPDGYLAPSQLDHVDRLPAGRPALIFVHHHPLPVQAPWIDRYPLHNGAALLTAADHQPAVRAIAFGHIHFAFIARRRHYRLYGTPATSVNSLRDEPRFTPDGRGPSWREFRLTADGRLTSRCHRLVPQPLPSP